MDKIKIIKKKNVNKQPQNKIVKIGFFFPV